MITIRIADANDAGLIADLSRSTFVETFASQNTQANMDKFLREMFSREQLMDEVIEKDNLFLLAYMGDEPVGYARLRFNNNPPSLGTVKAMEISRIYATTISIGKGVGKALMQKSIDIAKANEQQLVWLGVWKNNERAIRFYEQWGFEKFAEHTFMLGDDPQQDWLMRKQIS